MNEQYFLPKNPLEYTGKVIVLNTQSGQSRHDCLQQWLKQAENSGASTWLLSCDRDESGPWTGLKDLFDGLIPKLRITAPDLIAKHSYELAVILPALQKTILVQNPNLTDISSEAERTRNYPADRAIRIIHGLIDLLDAWYQHSDGSPWVIACDSFDCAGVLVQRFFVELIRRRGQLLNLTLILATSSKTSEIINNQFDSQYLAEVVHLHLPINLPAPISPQEMTKLAEELEQQVGQESIQGEIHLPPLIRYWLLSDQPKRALRFQIEAFSIYTTKGFYEDAVVYGEAALAQLEHYYPEYLPARLNIYTKLYNCYTGLGKSQQALEIAETAMARTNDPNYLFSWCYMMAMLYTRFLPEHDFVKAEAYLERGLQEIAKADMPKHMRLFQTAFNRNGLALIRHFQKRPQEAIAICQNSYSQICNNLLPDEHILHRSVLLYNIAQVYVAIGFYEEALTYFTTAMEMDPNYSEYYNERGNVFLKIGRLKDAEADYLKAIDLSPPYYEVWTNLGQCYALMGHMNEAVVAYSKAIDLDPQQFLALVGRAQIFEMLNLPDLALVDYSNALIIDANQPLLLANRATLHYEARRYQEALDDLNLAIYLNSEIADLYQNRAVAFTALGYSQEAAKDLNTYIRLNPTASDYSEIKQVVNFT